VLRKTALPFLGGSAAPSYLSERPPTGAARSRKTGGAQIAADAKHLIDTLRLDAYHILGFSDGGTAAYHLALNDERAQSVLTIGANWHSSQIEPARDMYESITPDFLREHMPAQVAAYEQQNPQPDLVTLTADLRHHPASEHLENGRPYLLCGTHWATEWVGLEPLARRLEEGARSHGGSLAVQVSRIVTDPWVLRLSTGSDRA